MKIQLTQDINVNPRHGMKKGREFEVIQYRIGKFQKDFSGFEEIERMLMFVLGDCAEEVGVFLNEAKVFCSHCNQWRAIAQSTKNTLICNSCLKEML